MRVSFVSLLVAVASLASPVRAEKAELEGVVNLNTAAADELGLIPGIGPARVRNILAYRHLHPFRSVDELARIKGIGHKMVRRWRQHLAVSGPSTAQKVVRPQMPFVGPPGPPAPAAGASVRGPPAPAVAAGAGPKPGSRTALPGPPPRPAPGSQRRGDPAHAWFPRAAGNDCRPPP